MHLTLALTHRCNLACGYCYAGEKFHRSMSFDTAMRAVSLAAKRLATGEVLTVGFFGGEPMLEWTLLRRVARTVQKLAWRRGWPLRFAITTNGTVLNEAHLRFFYTYDFQVTVSFDGLEDGHRAFVHGGGSAGRVWQNLQRAMEWLPGLSVITVLSPETVAGVVRTVEALQRIGVRRIGLAPNLDGVWPDGAWGLLEAALERVEVGDGLVVHPLSDVLSERYRMPSCEWDGSYVAVSPAGHLYPCGRLVGNDGRREVRIGHVSTGIDRGACSGLCERTDAAMEGAGVAGVCRCVPLMPGRAGHIQLANYQAFREVARRAARTRVRTDG